MLPTLSDDADILSLILLVLEDISTPLVYLGDMHLSRAVLLT